MEKVLIIEDDKAIADLIAIHLADIDLASEKVHDGKEGLLKALNNKYRMIILDIRLPGLDGLEICKRIRKENITTPVLMVTSKSEEIDKILGLEIGADDYITKPFSIRELVSRAKAILRRVTFVSQEGSIEIERSIQYGDLYIDINKRKVEACNRRIELTPKEFDLLVLLATNQGRTFTRMQLLNKVWGYDFEGFEHTVNSHINRLRSKIEKNMNRPEFILTTWGVGYRFGGE